MVIETTNLVFALTKSLIAMIPPVIALSAGISEMTRLIFEMIGAGNAQRFLVFARIPALFSMMARIVERIGALIAMTEGIITTIKWGP